MRTAQITINEDLHDQAVAKSKELFGEPNFSAYVRMLIKRDIISTDAKRTYINDVVIQMEDKR